MIYALLENHYIVSVKDDVFRSGDVPIPTYGHTRIGQTAVHEIQRVMRDSRTAAAWPSTRTACVAAIVIYFRVLASWRKIEKVAVPPPEHNPIDHHTKTEGC